MYNKGPRRIKISQGKCECVLPHLVLCVSQLLLFVGEPLTGGEMGIVLALLLLLVWSSEKAPAFQGSPLNTYSLCSWKIYSSWPEVKGSGSSDIKVVC